MSTHSSNLAYVLSSTCWRCRSCHRKTTSSLSCKTPSSWRFHYIHEHLCI